MSFFKVTCPWCNAEYYTGVVGMTYLGPTTPCCIGGLMQSWLVPAEGTAPWETMMDRIHRWPGTLCSNTFPG